MTQRHGLWLTFREGNEADAIDHAIQNNASFTAAVPTSIKPRLAELVVVSMTGEFADYVGIARAGARIATGQRRIAVVHLIELGELPIANLRAALPKRFADHNFGDRPVSRVSPRLWQGILEAMTNFRPYLASRLPQLRALIAELESGNLRRAGGLEVFERDAVASAIEVFGGTKLRKRVLRSAEPAADVKQPASFLAQLQQISLREDPQIIHDAATFPGMELAMRYAVGAVELENPRGERLTILNCNRQPLEATLGVDLIYYAHAFDSFVLVQYKRMAKQPNGAVVYRPSTDKNYAAELARMDGIEQILASSLDKAFDDSSGFRLSPRPLFFKLCEPRVKAALDEGMVSGMYVPLQLWRQYAASPDAKGKRGGVSIGWHNAPRHFSNGEFTNLLRHGWIGSTGRQSKLLAEIIKVVIESDHMLVLAATSSGPSGRDYLRDSLGRFAEEGDPLAAR